MTFEPIVGKNGRLYYNYNVGAKIVFKDERGEYTLEITACEYVGGREYYQVSRDGKPMLGRMSVNRLTYLLNHNQVKTIEIGTPCELPLTNEEVKIYADWLRRYNANAKRRVEQQIELTGYGALQNEYNSIAGRQAIAETRGDIEAADKYRQRMAEIENKMSEIVKNDDINLDILDLRPCERCGGTGFVAGNEALGICRCMRQDQSRIKALCAEWRK